MDKFTGIKNAVGVSKRWEEQDNRYRATIQFGAILLPRATVGQATRQIQCIV